MRLQRREGLGIVRIVGAINRQIIAKLISIYAKYYDIFILLKLKAVFSYCSNSFSKLPSQAIVNLR